MTKVLDALDLRLLTLVQDDSHRTAEELSKHLPLSPSAIMRRLRRLRTEKVIAAEVAILSADLVGYSITAVIRIQLDRHAHEDVELIRRALVDDPQVQICVEVSGPFDIMLVSSTRSMESFNEFVDQMLASNSAVRRYETEFVKKRLKWTLAVPVEGSKSLP